MTKTLKACGSQHPQKPTAKISQPRYAVLLLSINEGKTQSSNLEPAAAKSAKNCTCMSPGLFQENHLEN